ncbi:MAG: type III pantothenate kinase [Bdellovibrionales bacterium]
MLLAIDIGNTNTVFAVCKDDSFLNAWRLRSDARHSADEYAAFLHQLFDLSSFKWSDIKRVIISSVVPDANFNMRKFCEAYLNINPIFVTKDMVGVSACIDRPEDVGADRLVNAAAVKAFYSYPAIVIDFGTATTFDVINGDGNYAGGVIAPGVNLSIDALYQAASKLPQISVKRPQSAIGKSTISAMQSGVYWGYVGLIDRVLHEIASEIGCVETVIATGGLAPLFACDNDAIDVVDEHLTLKGLCYIANNND